MTHLKPVLWALVAAFVVPSLLLAQAERFDTSAVARLPVLDNGRVKPLDTYARETIRFLTGSETFQGHDPVKLLLEFAFNPKKWTETPLLAIGFRPLNEKLLLAASARYISASDLNVNREFSTLLDELRKKNVDTDKLPRLEKEAAMLFHRLSLFESQLDGRAWKLVPHQADAEAGWDSLEETKDPQVRTAVSEMRAAYLKGDSAAFEKAAGELAARLRTVSKLPYPDTRVVEREVWYHQFRPFEKAGILYLLAFAAFTVSVLTIKRRLYGLAMTLALAGFALHTYGLTLRALISGRAPVSNVYETLLFVPFGVVLFALILELVFRGRYIGMMSSLLGGGILLVSDFVSLDPYVSPLVPVLRSNYWLIIHVLTITLGYAGATLGLGLGHLWLGMYVFRGASAPELKNVENYLYRVVQVSVLFIGVGTVLGGVWANQSWGRYWGWDPKETWALISLLAFLAVVHARIVNSIAGFGTAVGTILAWQCVFFCWYGVNYFLTGLHSYAGGDQATVIPIWVYGWVIFEVAVLTVSWMCHRANTARIRA